MKHAVRLAGAAALALGLVAAATQVVRTQADQNAVSDATRSVYGTVKGYITRTATKVPEEHYAFQPTPEVRTFGQILGHIANANYSFCSAAAGEQNPNADTSIEKTVTTKAGLEKALGESFAYCDTVYDRMTDAMGAEKVKLFGNEMARLGVLAFNTAHDFEHYGNLVTYMRLKGIVPPSSEQSSQ